MNKQIGSHAAVRTGICVKANMLWRYTFSESLAYHIGRRASKEMIWVHSIRQTGRDATHGAPLPPAVFPIEKIEHQLLMVSPKEDRRGLARSLNEARYDRG
jgi:hypothetical protein